jgi:hypothetical protein
MLQIVTSMTVQIATHGISQRKQIFCRGHTAIAGHSKWVIGALNIVALEWLLGLIDDALESQFCWLKPGLKFIPSSIMMGMGKMNAAFSTALSLLSCASLCKGHFEPGDVVSPSLLSVVGSDERLLKQQTGGALDRQLRKKRIVGGERVEKGEYPFLALTKGRFATAVVVAHSPFSTSRLDVL